MPVLFTVDPASALPLYVQLATRIRVAIGNGSLKAGERMPTMREVALGSRMDLNTVARAYRDLEQAGLLVSQGSRGTFVTEKLPDMEPGQRREKSRRFAQETVSAALAEGLDPAEVARDMLDLTDRTDRG